jgi:hypothetical protein
VKYANQDCLYQDNQEILWQDFRAPSAFGPDETKWLMTTACSILDDDSYSTWQSLCTSTVTFQSICGWWQDNNYDRYPGMGGPYEFYDKISQILLDFEQGNAPVHSLWADQNNIPNDKAIVAWMEAAQFYTQDANQNPQADRANSVNVRYCAAVDANHRYVLIGNQVSWNPPLYDWKIAVNP